MPSSSSDCDSLHMPAHNSSLCLLNFAGAREHALALALNNVDTIDSCKFEVFNNEEEKLFS